MKVLVTNGENRAALAITRSLGRSGKSVIVGSNRKYSISGASKYCFRKFKYPDPGKYPEEFISNIVDVLKIEKPTMILPVTEITTLLITKNLDIISKYTKVPFPAYRDVRRAANKATILRLAQSLDIPIPDTRFIEKPIEERYLIELIRGLPYPIVIKPACSRYQTEMGYKPTGVSYAQDFKALVEQLGHIDTEAYPVLLQERIHGPGVGVFAYMNKGRMLAKFSHRRLREKPPSGGVSVLRESIAVPEPLKMQSEKLLKALDWYGVAMVEFKHDHEKKEYKLMEINGRYWGSLQLAIDAGVNFPLIHYCSAMGCPPAPDFNYKIGTRTRWLLGDLDHLLSRLINAKKLNLPDGYPSKFSCIKEFLRLNNTDQQNEVLNFHDIRPWILELLCWLKFKN